MRSSWKTRPWCRAETASIGKRSGSRDPSDLRKNGNARTKAPKTAACPVLNRGADRCLHLIHPEADQRQEGEPSRWHRPGGTEAQGEEGHDHPQMPGSDPPLHRSPDDEGEPHQERQEGQRDQLRLSPLGEQCEGVAGLQEFDEDGEHTEPMGGEKGHQTAENRRRQPLPLTLGNQAQADIREPYGEAPMSGSPHPKQKGDGPPGHRALPRQDHQREQGKGEDHRPRHQEADQEQGAEDQDHGGTGNALRSPVRDESDAEKGDGRRQQEHGRHEPEPPVALTPEVEELDQPALRKPGLAVHGEGERVCSQHLPRSGLQLAGSDVPQERVVPDRCPGVDHQGHPGHQKQQVGE